MKRLIENVFIFGLFFILPFNHPFLSAESVPYGEVVYAVAPAFPVLAYRARAYGIVQVEVDVDNSGSVIEAKTLESSIKHLFDESSEKAAKQWKFLPTPNDSAIRKHRITFRFSLMPYYTPEDEVTTIYIHPLEMEVRMKNEPAQRLPSSGSFFKYKYK
jgi:TonB family protein